ncbi:hypothetical protein [Streptomyces sp. T028]
MFTEPARGAVRVSGRACRNGASDRPARRPAQDPHALGRRREV